MEEIRERQQELYEMLKALADLQDKLDIRIFLVGGSALGAYRHAGFIPWDDDLDLALFRDDFEKLEQYLMKNACKLQDYIYSPVEYHLIKDAPIGHLYHFKKNKQTYEMAAKIDIHPIDGVPNNKLLQKLQSISALGYYLFVYQKPFKNKGKSIRVLSKWLLKLTPFGVRSFYRRLFKSYFTSFPVEKADVVCSLFGVKGYQTECMPKKYLEPLTLYKFETGVFYAPADMPSYLQRLFGDYMTPPPLEKQVPEHAHQRICVDSLELFYEPVKNQKNRAAIY